MQAGQALLVLVMIMAGGCASAENPTPGDVPPVTAARAQRLDDTFTRLIEQHGVHTAGIGIIRDAELVWAGYYGEQRPGVPASQETLFNVASITKVVTAEAFLRLVDDGIVSLDEPMAPYWTDPDLAGDPRTQRLTPRMVLNHTTGLPNWRFFLEDNTLRFLNDPGEKYGYSGEGFEYLARYASERLGKGFDEVVQERVFEPIAMTDVAYRIDGDTFERIARSLDERGAFHGHFCRPNGWCSKAGSYSAADDMVVSVEDFASFMIAVMNGDGYGGAMAAERNRVQTDKGDQALVICARVPAELCPDRQGYGLGWEVLDYGGYQLLTHGGSDWAEVALSYIYTRSRDGLLIFLNAPNARGLAAMPDAIEAIDPGSPMIDLYRRRAEKVRGEAQELSAMAY